MTRRVTDKEKYEYVSLIDPDLVAVDARQVGDALKKCLASAKQELQVHAQKHKLIAKAKETVNNLDNDIIRFEKYAKWKLFEKKISKKEVKANKLMRIGMYNCRGSRNRTMI